jgi:hypothetical protein
VFAVLFAIAAGGSQWPVLSARAEAKYLSAQLHRLVTVPDSLANHLLYVRRAGGDPDLELRAVAAALRARIEMGVRHISMVRTAADDRNYAEVWAAGRAKWIEARVKRAEAYRRDYRADENPADALNTALRFYVTAIQHLGTPGRHDVTVETNTCQLGPSGRLMLDAIRTLGVSKIAAVPARTTVIFETDPRGGARRLPDFEPSLERYETLLASLQSFKAPAQAISVEGSGLLTGVGQAIGPPVYARLRVGAREGSLAASIEAFDEGGKLVASDGFLMSADNEDITGAETVAKAAMAEIPRAKKVRLPKSLVALDEMRADVGIPLWVQRPKECEPLTAYASFAMDQLVGPEAPCAVVDMSDGLVNDARISVDLGQLNLTAFKKVIDRFDPYETVTENGFLVERPVDPFLGNCADRADLQTFVQSALESKYIDVRALAKAADPYSPLWGLYLRELVNVSVPDVDGSRQNLPFPVVIRLIRAITDSDWNALMAGQTETADQLGVTGKLLALLDELGISTDSKTLPARFRHPAELYVGNEFDKTPIRIVFQSEPVFRMTGVNAPEWTRWDPQSSGVFQLSLRTERLDGVPKMEMTRDQFEAQCDARYRFQTGVRNLASFQICLPGGNTITSPMPRPIEDVSSQISYLELPQDLRDCTWQIICRAALGELNQRHGG